MKLRFASLLILLSFASWSQAAVIFRDLNPQDEEFIRKELPVLNEANPSLANLDEAIRRLMAHGTYENIFIERDAQGGYAIVGKPLRIVEDIQIKGASKVSESDLRDLIDFKVGDRFDRKRAVAAGEKMKTYYGEHGFFNTVIELNFQKAENKNIRIVFDIQEKPPCIIKGLDFETANTDLKALLQSSFRSLRGKPLTTERVRTFMRDLEDLLIENRYLATETVPPDAKYNPEHTEAYLVIEVREPFKYEFYFEGNTAFSVVDIYRALDLRNRDRKNVDPASEGAERLRRAYLERGFPNVQIETRVANAEGSYLKRVYYKIVEGPRVKIKAIEVQGRISRPSAYYQDFILHNSSDLVSEGYYNRQALENGFKNMITELRNQGFLHARVLSSRVEYSDNKDRVTVYLMLEEGPQTQIRGLDFLGNKFFSSFELAQITGLETNTPLRLDNFEASLNKLRAFYHNQGFLEMRLLNEGEDLIQYNDKGTQARIVFQIYEGPRIRVHAISVDGNILTKTQVILKETDFKLGEVLTPQKVDDAVVRLNKMGLFSRVDVRTLEEGTTVSERTLVISVTERDPGLFTFGGGVTNERNLTLRGFTGASYNNLWGTARAISLRGEVRSNVAEVRYPENEITAGFLEPFIFNTRTRGRVNLTRSEYVFDYQPANSKLTEITVKNRIDFLVERDLTQHTKFTFKTWSLESRKDFDRYGRCLPDPNADPNSPAAKFDPNKLCSPNIMQVAAVGPQIDIDYRDNPFLPTRGAFTRLSLDYSNPNIGSSQGVEFVKTEGTFSYHQPLGSPRLVWANSIRGGYLSNLSRQKDSGVPADWAFLLGGIYTVRGFDLSNGNERIPKEGDGAYDRDGKLNPNHPQGFKLGEANQKLIRGDSHFYLFKSELRFPIYDEFGGVLFYDGGGVEISGYYFKRPYRDAVGFGFRYNTLVGPLAADFSFKIRPEPDENLFRFNFSIGTF